MRRAAIGLWERPEDRYLLSVSSGIHSDPADWSDARRADESLLTEWQIYRMFEGRRGAWSTFQFLIRERLVGSGARVAPDGRVV